MKPINNVVYHEICFHILLSIFVITEKKSRKEQSRITFIDLVLIFWH